MTFARWLLLSLMFLGIAAGADAAFTRWAIYADLSSNSGRIHHLLLEDGDEIAILGSSKVYHDYIPAQMGLDAFNYGLDGTSFDVADALLSVELSKRKTAPIIIDLKPDAEHGIGDPASYIPFVFDPGIHNLLERSGALVWRYYIPGVRYFGYYDQYLKDLINDRAHLMRTVERGFTHERYWQFDRARLDEAVHRRLQGPNGYFPDPDQNRRLFEHIRQHPERLFFVVYSPVHSSCFTNFQNQNEFNAFKARLGTLPNAVVLDFQQSNYPDEWFMDTNHLLYEGAVDFSRKLGARIRKELRERALRVAPVQKTTAAGASSV
jgi:hypothetical protein